MIKLLSCFIILISSISIYAQPNSVHCNLFNYRSKQSIGYATVHVVGSNRFRDANEMGHFEITATDNDSIMISCIGFTPLTILASQIKMMDSIFLKEQSVMLSNVTIAKSIPQTFGIVNEKKERTCVGGAEGNRYELATLIKISEKIKGYRLSKIFLKGKDFKSVNPVRLHIYSIDSAGFPDKELLTEEVIITADKSGNNLITVDLKKQNIIMDGGSFFAGIQWISSDSVKEFTGPQIFETTKVKQLLTYRRALKTKNNQWFAWYKTGIVFLKDETIPKDANPINMLISAEIEEFSQ